MSKPEIPFDTVPYSIGGKSGNRPVLQLGKPVNDLDFAEEVVKEKRLSASAFEALHIVEAFAEVGPQKTSEDGRPRGITKLIKWEPRANGSLASPDSPWGGNCVAKIVPRLMTDATKTLDATFRNVNAGVGVSIDNVTYLGATGVQNVIKPGVNFAAYGDHMEMLEGDLAALVYGETVIPLVCVSSDVSRAEFEFPLEAAAIPADANIVFELRSRGGVEDGQVYVNRKTVKMGTYTGTPLIAWFQQEGKSKGEFGIDAGAIVTVKGAGFTKPNVINAKLGKLEAGGNSFAYAFNPTSITVLDDNTVTCKVSAAEDPDQTDENLSSDSAAGNIVLRLYTQMTRSNDVTAHYVA